MGSSQRPFKPGLFDKLDTAIEQAGADTDSDRLYSAITHSIKFATGKYPWLSKNFKSIAEKEGGTDEMVLSIAGFALALMRDGAEFWSAVTEGRNEYVNLLRKQWDGSRDSRVGFDNPPEPLYFGDISGPEDQPIEDWLDSHMLYPDPPPPPWDGQLTDPRLQHLWDTGTPQQRELMVLVADGLTPTSAGLNLGGSVSAGNSRVTTLRKKASTFEKATGGL